MFYLNAIGLIAMLLLSLSILVMSATGQTIELAQYIGLLIAVLLYAGTRRKKT